MKSTPLQTYLHDHLAGAALAVNLLETLASRPCKDGLYTFASTLLDEIREDVETLRRLSSRIESHSAGLKETAARFVEKLSHLKFHRNDDDTLGAFEALETLALGILGKQALWTALACVNDPRLGHVDYDTLLQRARSQHAHVEQRRLSLAKAALAEDDS